MNAPIQKPRRYRHRRNRTVVGSITSLSPLRVFHDYEVQWTQGRAGLLPLPIRLILAVSVIVALAYVVIRWA